MNALVTAHMSGWDVIFTILAALGVSSITMLVHLILRHREAHRGL